MFDAIQPVTISERAVREIHQIMKTKNIPADYGLRVGVKGGGCGVTMIIGFDQRQPSDHAYEIEGIDVYVDRKHTLYLMGKEVDFYDGDEGRGFTFVDKPMAH